MNKSIGRFITSSALLLHILIAHHAVAQSFSLEAGKKNINMAYEMPFTDEVTTSLIMETSLLYTKQNEHQDLFASAGFTALTNIGNDFNIGAGFKIIVADPIDYYLSAVASGVELNYQSAANFKFDSGIYYAGESLTFSDGSSVSILTVDMDYQVIEDTFVRVGYRRIKTEHTNGITTDFDRGAYLGLFWQF